MFTILILREIFVNPENKAGANGFWNLFEITAHSMFKLAYSVNIAIMSYYKYEQI